MLELNQLYNMDCMEGMEQFPDKYFDLAIVDPPYGLGDKLTKGGKGHGFDSLLKGGSDRWDIIPSNDYFDNLFRISVNQIIWGGNFYSLPPTKHPLCWNKLRPNQKKLSEWEMAWTSFDGRARMFTFCANGGFITKEKRIHPTQKPVQLYKWILHNYAEPNFKIIDTHAGSCSSVIAFLDYECGWIAFEIDKDYYKAASKRIENHKNQLRLQW